MSRGRRRTMRVLAGVILGAIGLGFLALSTVDKTPYAQTPEGKTTLARLDSLDPLPEVRADAPLLVGWGKANITPEHPVPIIGYGRRGPFEYVADSVYVRCFLFEQGTERVAIISYDLLLVAPALVEAVEAKLGGSELGITGIYFSASHTHKSFGGYGDGVVGSYLLGGEDAQLLDRLAGQTLLALEQAEATMDTASLGFGSVDGSAFVKNRLIEGGPVDSLVRLVRIRQNDGDEALLWTFAAHATCLWARLNALSGDYPSLTCKALEETGDLDFALYCAGAVGSHSQPSVLTLYSDLLAFSDSLAALIRPQLPGISTRDSLRLALRTLPLDLRAPQVRLSKRLRVSTGVFHWLNGRPRPYLKALALGDVLLVGTPCDFSGMLSAPLDSLAATKGRHLMITSFNGDYIGYITPDEYYHKRKKETWDMNWYAPGSGSWMSALIEGLIEKTEPRRISGGVRVAE